MDNESESAFRAIQARLAHHNEQKYAAIRNAYALMTPDQKTDFQQRVDELAALDTTTPAFGPMAISMRLRIDLSDGSADSVVVKAKSLQAALQSWNRDEPFTTFIK